MLVETGSLQKWQNDPWALATGMAQGQPMQCSSEAAGHDMMCAALLARGKSSDLTDGEALTALLIVHRKVQARTELHAAT